MNILRIYYEEMIPYSVDNFLGRPAKELHIAAYFWGGMIETLLEQLMPTGVDQEVNNAHHHGS